MARKETSWAKRRRDSINRKECEMRRNRKKQNRGIGEVQMFRYVAICIALVFYCHFNSSHDSTANMSILGLLYASQDATKRKTLEKRLIFSLPTLYPNGLNKHFNFLQQFLFTSISFSFLTFLPFPYSIFCCCVASRILSIYQISPSLCSVRFFSSHLLENTSSH